MDETYVTIAGRWSYLYRAVDQHLQVIDMLALTRRDASAARHFFTRALRLGPRQSRSPRTGRRSNPRVLDELVPAARHVSVQYANNRVEADHSRLKARLRPMRGLKGLASARTISSGQGFVQDLRRGHYELTADVAGRDRVRVAFDGLAM